MNKDRQAITGPKAADIHRLYNRYGAMLLGYLCEILKDRKLAEEYLVMIFNDIARKYDAANNYTWCQLQVLAKSKLAFLADTLAFDKNSDEAVTYTSASIFPNAMNDEQKHVFYAVYYLGKPIALLSQQLNKTEQSIRRTLMEAFTLIRQKREY